MDYEHLVFIFVMLIPFFLILAYTFFIIWIYKDCKERGESPLLWILLLFFTSLFLGLIIYLIVRKEKKVTCKSCDKLISSSAKYCEHCGVTIQNGNDVQVVKQKTNRKYIIAGISSFAMIFICVIFIVIIGLSTSMNVKSKSKVWNRGFETFSTQTKIGNSWKMSLKSATEGFIKEASMDITNPEEEVLYLDVSCDVKEDGGNLMLWLVQGDTVRSIDITNLSGVLQYPLNEFKEGKIFVRLQINNVKNVKSEIIIE